MIWSPAPFRLVCCYVVRSAKNTHSSLKVGSLKVDHVKTKAELIGAFLRRTDGQTDGQTDRRTDGRTGGRTYVRTCVHTYVRTYVRSYISTYVRNPTP